MDILAPFEEVSYTRGSLYDFPEWYEVDYAGYLAEERFYRFAIEHFLDAGAYVEIGAGTGRLLLRYALEGVRCHAVEPATPMLDWLLGQAAHRGVSEHVSAEASRGDVFVGPAVPARVIAFPFNGILHVTTHAELDALLRHVRAKLAPGGAFAVDITCPSWEAMTMGEVPWGRVDERVHPVDGERVLTCDRTRYYPERRVMRTQYRFVREHQRRGYHLQIEQRMWTFPEVTAALTRAGLAVAHAFGDVDLRPLRADSPRLLLIATVA